MKKRFVILALSIVAAWLTAAANEVTLSEVSGRPGQEVAVALTMTGTDEVTAIDLRLPLGEGLDYVDGSARLGQRASGHRITASAVGGELRLVVFSLDLAPIAGSEGEVLTFDLRLGNRPGTFALEPAVVLGDAAGGRIDADVTPGSVTCRCPELTIETPETDFGHVPIRSIYTAQVGLRNSGNEPLTIHSFAPEATELSVEPCTDPIAPGEVRYVQLSFAPTERTPFSSKVAVDCDAANRLVYGRLQAFSVVADPFSVNELYLGSALGASDTEVTVSVRMNNMEPIVGVQFSIDLPEAVRYVEGSVAPAERAQGLQAASSVTGNRLTVMLYSLANTPVSGDDGELLTFRLHLVGRNGWYWLSPDKVVLSNASMENMTSAVEGGSVEIQSPTYSGDSSLDFGQQPLTEPVRASYTLGNYGSAPLEVDRVTFLAEGYSCITPLPLTVEPWQQGRLTIEYTPDGTGDFATTMNVYSNDPEQRMTHVALSGRVYSPNALSLSGYYDKDKGYTVSVDLTNHSDIYGLQFDLKVEDPTAVAGEATAALTDRTTGFTKSMTKMADGHYRILLFDLGNRSVAAGEGAVLEVVLPGGSTLPDSLGFSADGIVLSTLTSQNVVTPGLEARASIETFERGDANADRRITISDATTIINHLMDNEVPKFSRYAADVNGDGKITIGDATSITNLLLK